VVHVVVGSADLRALRREAPGRRIALYVPSGAKIDGRAVAAARLADLVIVEGAAELGELMRREPDLEQRLRILRRPLDLERHAPEPRLLETPLRGRSLRRFRRFHRLVPPTVLYAGPYTDEGGLDLALEAVFFLRGSVPEARIAAIPDGRVDASYRDRIERRALALGHHGVVEWAAADDEVPFWYAVADVVCAPHRVPLDARSAAMAAAAARPWIGSDFPLTRAYVDDGATGLLLPAGDLEAMTAALMRLAGDEEEAGRLGTEARRRAERTLTPAGVGDELRSLWQEALSLPPAIPAAENGAVGMPRFLRALRSPAQ
jgi:glycosyltransferase involved in cell wall biosynthesis